MSLTAGMRTMRASLSASRLLDGAYGATIVCGTLGLFWIDIHSERGVLDGIAYPASVALAARFGRRPVLICAGLVSVLIVAGAVLAPAFGISIAGELANRFFALLSVWIVALVLNQRFGLEHFIATHETTLARHQQALLDAVHRVLFVDLPLKDRIPRLTEIAAKSVEVDNVSVFRWREDGAKLGECLDAYHRHDDRHEPAPDMEENQHPDFVNAMRRDLVVVVNDVRAATFLATRRKLLAQSNVGAAIGAGIFLDGKMVGQVVFSHLHTPRNWTKQEIAFARALANMMSILFSADRNSETLAALDLVSEGIYATAESGSILYANRAAREIAAAAARIEDGAALTASAYPHPTTPLQGAIDRHEILFAGTELEIQRARLPRGGIITRINDVTARNAATQESARLQKRLQQAAKMEAIGQLAGGIAHDFSNILSSIMGFARFLEEDLPPKSEEQGFAMRILSACERGKNLVDQILDFALTKTARQDNVDLGTVIRQCSDHLLPILPPGIILKVIAEEDFAFVIGNAVQLSQIVTNLCVNARDAMNGRAGTIQLDLTHANFSERDRVTAVPGEIWVGEIDGGGRYACICVSDAGEGIAAQNLPRIFEPFFTTKSRQRGVGLGLAVVHGAVAAHQGACHVRSEPGIGTTMSVYLPIADSSPDCQFKQDNIKMFGKECVLLVDDEVDIVETMSRGLSRLGYHTVGTEDPEEVVRAVEKDGAAWDIVITDQMMPNLGGLELIKKIKALRPDLLTILCTGYGEAADEQSALNAGADAYIRKPVDAEALARCIRRLRAEKRTV